MREILKHDKIREDNFPPPPFQIEPHSYKHIVTFTKLEHILHQLLSPILKILMYKSDPFMPIFDLKHLWRSNSVLKYKTAAVCHVGLYGN